MPSSTGGLPGEDAQPGVVSLAEAQAEEAGAKVVSPQHRLVVSQPLEGKELSVPPAQARPTLGERSSEYEGFVDRPRILRYVPAED